MISLGTEQTGNKTHEPDVILLCYIKAAQPTEPTS